MLKLNVGCGDKHLEGFMNLDLPEFDATKKWNMKTGSIDVVNMDCVLPHIQDGKKLDFLIRETARVLKPSTGIFTFSVPDWRQPEEALQDVYHYRLIGPRTFWHYTGHDTNRPLEASGNYFMKPTWKWRPVEPGNLEGYVHPLVQVLDFTNLGAIPLGKSKMNALTHFAIRTRQRWMLRSGRLNWTMKRNGEPWRK